MGTEDLLGLGMEADAERHRLHPEDVVTYDTDLTLTLSSLPLSPTLEALRSIDGANLRIALSPGDRTSLTEMLRMLGEIEAAATGCTVHGLCATDIASLSRAAGCAPGDTLRALRDAGLTTLGGEDALVLGPELDRTLRSQVCSTDEWLAIHRTAHSLGLRSSAGMTFGAGETAEQQVSHLALLRDLQAQTGGFLAFTPRIYRRDATTTRDLEEATAVDYLKVVAVSRLFLTNFTHIQTTWNMLGLKVLQMALKFGGNDAGSVEAFPPSSLHTSEETVRQVIRDAGFRPSQRSTDYSAHLFQ